MIYLAYELRGAILIALLIGVGCGFAERWMRHKKRRPHD